MALTKLRPVDCQLLALQGPMPQISFAPRESANSHELLALLSAFRQACGQFSTCAGTPVHHAKKTSLIHPAHSLDSRSQHSTAGVRALVGMGLDLQVNCRRRSLLTHSEAASCCCASPESCPESASIPEPLAPTAAPSSTSACESREQ